MAEPNPQYTFESAPQGGECKTRFHFVTHICNPRQIYSPGNTGSPTMTQLLICDARKPRRGPRAGVAFARQIIGDRDNNGAERKKKALGLSGGRQAEDEGEAITTLPEDGPAE